ncbi:uncharacterized protein LOC111335134 isoform X2 [Stylophora pistillata]|uniref:Ankyrin-2 n=1 Tax=Stylophora pistillata TaxID=50429 RepID=A0A2B4RY62_STYPI|nr:uncharacterized protein LOC111335134 isoform X2 [Stylophora pistillata]PFX21723.1 Ankyrin-2 [Stylophora pistillata]
MGTGASKTGKPNDENTDGQKMVLQIINKCVKNDGSKVKPSPSVELEVDIRDMASPDINVMFICSEWGSTKGGLSTFNRKLAVNLAKVPNERIKVHCYVSESSEADRRDASSKGVNLITAERSPGSSGPLDWLKTPPPDLKLDIVVAHGRKFGSAAYFIQKITNCRWIQFVHVYCEALGKYKLESGFTGDAIADNEEKNRRELELCKASNLVVAVGSLLQRKYQRSLPDIKVEVITPGIFEEYTNLTATQSVRKLTEEEFSIFIFGRGSFEDFALKGYDIIGKAVASLERKFELTFVGARQDEPRKIEEWLLEETNISRNQLTIRGFCNHEEMKRMLREADLVVMPSRTEGFGLVALETISAGVPVLVSSETGIAKALLDLEDGMSVVVESEKSEEWANRILRLSEQTVEDRHTNALQLRDQYNKRYSWEKECKRFAKMILDLVESAQNELPLNICLTGNTTLRNALKTLRADNIQAPKNEDGGQLNGAQSSLNITAEQTFEKAKKGPRKASDTCDKTAEHTCTTERKPPGQGADNVKRGKEKDQSADPETSNETREQRQGNMEEVQTAGNTTLKDADVPQAGPTTSDKKVPKDENGQQSNTGATSANQNKDASVDQLRFAARRGDVSEIESLLSRGLCVDSRNISKQTPLMYAAVHGKVEAVQCLISKGADPDSRDNRGRNSLHCASYGGGVGVIELLVSHLTDNEPRGTSGETPLMIAAKMGQVKAVQYLISKGADPASSDYSGWNSLHWASNRGQVDVIELLVSHMTDVEPRGDLGETPVMVAARMGQVMAVQYLISKGADPASTDDSGWNSLHWASRGDHVDVIELLVSHMADTELRNGLGETPLMVAAKEGKVEAVQCLISKGANPALRDKSGRNSLHLASYDDHIDVIELLVSHMSDVDSRGLLGQTPLMVAAKEGKVEAVQCLISKGANPTSSDDSGRNSLHWATVKGNKDIIDILLSYGVDIESKTEDGLTPLMMARRHGLEGTVRYLLKKGAESPSLNKGESDKFSFTHAQ